jgi:hypothetical protein
MKKPTYICSDKRGNKKKSKSETESRDLREKVGARRKRKEEVKRKKKPGGLEAPF